MSANIQDMFEQATRLKLRYETPLGMISVEDLWELPLTDRSRTGLPRAGLSLDSIAMELHRASRDAAEVTSFVDPLVENKTAERLALRFEIVKHIIGVRVQERDELKAAADRREKRQRVLELIARKEEGELGEKSIEELRALAESL
jgi:hypothetical protein